MDVLTVLGWVCLICSVITMFLENQQLKSWTMPLAMWAVFFEVARALSLNLHIG